MKNLENNLDKSKSIVSSLILLGIILSFLLGIFLNSGNSSKKQLIKKDTIIIYNDNLDFSEDKLKERLSELNIKYPDIVYAQAVLESANFTSNLFIENSNLFGMKAAKQRPYTYSGVKNGFAYYNTWKMSVLDYALFQSHYMSGLSRQEYFKYLERNYAEDPNYVNKLKKIINSNS